MPKIIILWFFSYLLLSPIASAESSYSWYTFNIPPFGSEAERGIGYVLANAYVDAGFENKVILATLRAG
jgi:hypothetical protein